MYTYQHESRRVRDLSSGGCRLDHVHFQMRCGNYTRRRAVPLGVIDDELKPALNTPSKWSTFPSAYMILLYIWGNADRTM